MAMAEAGVPMPEDANAPAGTIQAALGHLHASVGHDVAT